ncbi:MAG: glycoside hydrolase family 43 protein [Turicibacter sp.]|nr:glycoside hydrolase family 43 protein [Turicibacter sp.]
MSTFKNPVLPGFNPDPSVCVVGEDYYLVTSTFAYFPGVPIYHSRDLVNWRQIGNVLNRESQIKLTGISHSQGIFAPTIRYHKGTFYLITTNVSYGGNFIVTATDPAGPWSEPIFLNDAPGIDPSLFFDEDGKCYYTGTRPNPRGERYNGDWEVWLQELDLNTMQLIGVSTKLWKGALRGAIWPEGPHIYKKDGYYYLLIAEGGTGDDHAITISRSKTISGPYSGNPKNPILTHRHLGLDYFVQNVGHGDLIKTSCGKWYMTCLASRMYQKHSNLGRETFLAEVSWEKGWPVVNAGHGKLLAEQTHQLPLHPFEKKTRYDFKDGLDMAFLSLRTPQPDFYTIEKGKLYLKTLPETIGDLATPAYLALRQTSMFFTLETKMSFIPKEEEEAGLAIVQRDTNHLQFTYRLVEGVNTLEVTKVLAEDDDVSFHLLKAVKVEGQTLYLRIKGHEQALSFYYSLDGKAYHEICAGVDARFLSTEAAGGFVGNTMGIYATSNDESSYNRACFEWLDLRN